MTGQITYESLKAGEEGRVVHLVLSVFDQFVAPVFSGEGIAEFKKFATVEALTERLGSNGFVVVAKQGENLVGSIEIVDNHHVALFFVRPPFQKKGVGQTLLRHALHICLKNKPDLTRLTVNSSPNAQTAYEKMGFAATEAEQLVNGIRFTPMEMKLGG